MGALSVDRFDHYRKQDPLLISDNDSVLILNGFMQSIRTLGPLVLNQVHPQFKEILQNTIRAGHAYLTNKKIRFDPNGYPLNEVEPLLEAIRQKRLEKEPLDEGDGGLSVSDHRKTYFFERPPDRATSSAPKAQSSVRLSARVATAHNLTSTHGRARLKSAAGARRRPTSGLPTIRELEPVALPCAVTHG